MFADVTALVLDGGRATRMEGRHKAFLELEGEPLAARTHRLLASLCAEVLVATNRPEPWRPFGVRVVEDPVTGAGPLAGIAAGLGAARTPLVLVVAGDMPSLSGAVLEELVHRARLLPGRAVVPTVAGRAEPLHAVYPAALAPLALRALLAGTRAPRDFLATAPAVYVDSAELRGLAGAARTFDNLNSPADLAARTAGR